MNAFRRLLQFGHTANKRVLPVGEAGGSFPDLTGQVFPWDGDESEGWGAESDADDLLGVCARPTHGRGHSIAPAKLMAAWVQPQEITLWRRPATPLGRHPTHRAKLVARFVAARPAKVRAKEHHHGVLGTLVSSPKSSCWPYCWIVGPC